MMVHLPNYSESGLFRLALRALKPSVSIAVTVSTSLPEDL